MTIKELKQILSDFPDDLNVLEGPTPDGAADFLIREVNDGEDNFLLIVPLT